MTDKSAQAFRTIGEAAAEIGVPHHVLRFWETRFEQLQPLKRGGNRRYYRPADMALLHDIHRMLHTDGLTIRGAQKLLAEKGDTPLSPPRPSVSPSDTGHDVKAAPGPQLTGSPTAPPVDLARLRAIRDRLAAALAA